MNHKVEQNRKLRTCSQTSGNRYLNPNDITIAPGYQIEAFLQGLDAPVSFQFAADGSLYIAESGESINAYPRILRLINGNLEFVADGFNNPVTGVSCLGTNTYVSHRGNISVIAQNGSRREVLGGLPSSGDYLNSKVVFGVDNKMYFGQGTVTNSGVVGLDNTWLTDRPFLHDYPGTYIMLQGQNFITENVFSAANDTIYTGAFSPYGVENTPFEVRKGIVKASGSILKANLDGSNIELVVWGIRNPFQIKFDEAGRLFAVNRDFDIRGSRPIANAPDEFYLINPGEWYGWPDFTGGEPVTMERFQPEGEEQPQFLLTNHPGTPPKPYSLFPPHTTLAGFEFNYNSSFGPYGDVYIAEFGSMGAGTVGRSAPFAGIGHRISRIDIKTGGVTTFAINKSGFSASVTNEGGLSRPVDVTFGPDEAMYVLDEGTYDVNTPNRYNPNTGVIWRITRAS